MPPFHNKQRFVEKVIEILGGKERFKQVVDNEFIDMRRRWDLDVTNIGRILRSHLYVEHYLMQHITKANPRLGDTSKARLTFSQKLSLLDTSHTYLSELIPGLRQINLVRNRLAHRLEASLTAEDVQVFLSHAMFNAMRIEGAKPSAPSMEPIDVLEEFAQYAAHLMVNEFCEVAIAIRKVIAEDAVLSDL